ncbi:hypothetical protein [Xenorhabdus sp. KK7.4]|nr:hypothetical protein [Xenorhabdus sp. KK7.4]PHM51268.1 hypothetical protein Xekk_03841 [Xenorhabdus sp. KK7.4]
MKENIKFNKNNLEMDILKKINEHDKYNDKFLYLTLIVYTPIALL